MQQFSETLIRRRCFQEGCNISIPSAMLHAVQVSKVFPDSKTFVDRPLSVSPAELHQRWDMFQSQWTGDVKSLTTFVESVTNEAESDLISIIPSDWEEKDARWLSHCDESVREWALFIHSSWQDLCRRTHFAADRADQHSVYPLEKPFFIAGDRFREIYYWDSYWIVMGLIVSEMWQSALDQVEGLISLLRHHGFVPNGGRTYYNNRSQPPLLSAMFRRLFDLKHQNKVPSEIKNRIVATIKGALPLLIEEYGFWTQPPHGVQVKEASSEVSHTLSRYYASIDLPRAESYKEDLDTWKQIGGDGENGSRDELFREIASAAESGHDFSSRWLQDISNLSSIQTTKILPVDLNAFLFQMENNIAFFASSFNTDSSTTIDEFGNRARARQRALDNLFWDANQLQWRDRILDEDQVSGVVREGYLSNIIPLACGVALPKEISVKDVIERIRRSPLRRDGGYLTSIYTSGQQWDAPNIWPPLQCFLIEGLLQLEQDHPTNGAKELAEDIALAFLQNAYQGYRSHHCMLEKYNTHSMGSPGEGGEYTTQIGFGWTNGVVLWLLQQYGRRFRSSE